MVEKFKLLPAYILIPTAVTIIGGCLYYFLKWTGVTNEHIPVIGVIIIFILLARMFRLKEENIKLKKQILKASPSQKDSRE